jgi:hypothetical protein
MRNLTSPCDMPHGQVVIITRTAAQNEYICRVAAATLMNRKATPSQIPWLPIGPAYLFMWHL